MTTTHPAELNNGVWTSWLPLTTAFPSQAGCNTEIWARYGIDQSRSWAPYIYDPDYGSSVANALTCLPTQVSQWWDPIGGSDTGSTQTGLVTSYSIGPIVCPAAYVTVSTSVISSTSTAVFCCPSSYEFSNLAKVGGAGGLCTSSLTVGQVLAYDGPATSPVGFTSTTTTYTYAGVIIGVPVVGYNFAASTPTASPSSGTTTSTGSASASATTTPPSGGLSTGAKAGIGAGVGAVGLVLIVIAGIFLLRRRKGVHKPPPPLELPGDKHAQLAELHVYEQPQELSSQDTAHLQPQELHA